MVALVRTIARQRWRSGRVFPAAFSGQQQRSAHSYISQSKNIDPLVEDIIKRLQPLGVSFIDYIAINMVIVDVYSFILLRCKDRPSL